METYKQQFIEFMVASDALTFGDFVTKSGRQTPYFINSGNFADGPRISQLGEWYARAINDRIGSGCENLYGPAYKGIPLAVTTAAALWNLFEHRVQPQRGKGPRRKRRTRRASLCWRREGPDH